jgi:hypothetical protein
MVSAMQSSWVWATIGAMAFCGACSIEPQPPGLLVATAPPGASCLLTRQNQTIAAIGSTPAIVRGIDSGAGAGGVTIACRRPGFAETTVNLPQTGSPAAYPERIDIALAPAPPGVPLLPAPLPPLPPPPPLPR